MLCGRLSRVVCCFVGRLRLCVGLCLVAGSRSFRCGTGRGCRCIPSLGRFVPLVGVGMGIPLLRSRCVALCSSVLACGFGSRLGLPGCMGSERRPGRLGLGGAGGGHHRQLGTPGVRLVSGILLVLGSYLHTTFTLASSVSALARFTLSRSERLGFFKRPSTRPWERSKSDC
mgnify:CR=1 FL=1